MRRSIALVMLTAAFAGTPAGSAPAQPAPNQYHENFNTTVYRDPAATTAWWDTMGGRLTVGMVASPLIGGIDTPGYARDVCVDGRYAFVADESGGLRVYDTGNPSAPAFLGAYQPGNTITTVAVDGDYVAVGGRLTQFGGHWSLLSVVNPAAPAAVFTPGFWSGIPNEVVIDGDLCLMALGGSGLRLIDLTAPSAPSILSTFDTAGSAAGVAPWGRHAVVADGTAVVVLDISNRSAVTLAGSCPAANARRVAVDGRYAFVADGTVGLLVVDLADPSTPTVVATAAAPGASDVCVDGNWAYLSAGSAGVHVYDVRDPHAPVQVGVVDTPGSALGLALQGDLLHVADGAAGLQIYRIARLVTPPERVGRFAIDIGASAVAIHGDLALVTTNGNTGTEHSRLLLLDISDPAAPLRTGHIWLGNAYEERTVDVVPHGDRALVAWNWWNASYPDGQNARITSVDISDPAVPVVTFSAGWSEEVLRFTVRGGRIFAVGRARSTPGGFWVWDASDPDAMSSLATTLTIDRYAAGVEVVGNHAFILEPLAGANNNLQVYDVTNPGLPVRAWNGYMSFGYGAARVLCMGNHAIMVGGSGLTVFDITSPGTPVYGTTYIVPAGSTGRATRIGRYLATIYRHTYNGTFGLIDVSDPLSPVPLAQSAPSWFGTGVAAAGDHAFVATTATATGSGQGLDIYRIFERGVDASANVAQSLTLDWSPLPLYGARILSTVQSGQIAWQLSADGGATWEGVTPGLDWHRFQAQGSDLRWRAELGTGSGGEPAVCEEFIIQWYHTDVADAGPAALPVRYALAGGAPNPFNARTEIAFDVPAGGGHVRISVFDLRGRIVRHLLDGVQAAGTWQAVWDGRDDRGRDLPAGTYVCLMQAPGCRESLKLSLVP